MTMNKALYPRSGVARLHISRKNGERGLIRCEISVKSETDERGFYVKNNIEPLIAPVRTNRTIRYVETVDPKEFKKTKEENKTGLQKECMGNLLQILRRRIRTTHGNG